MHRELGDLALVRPQLERPIVADGVDREGGRKMLPPGAGVLCHLVLSPRRRDGHRARVACISKLHASRDGHRAVACRERRAERWGDAEATGAACARDARAGEHRARDCVLSGHVLVGEGEDLRAAGVGQRLEDVGWVRLASVIHAQRKRRQVDEPVRRAEREKTRALGGRSYPEVHPHGPGRLRILILRVDDALQLVLGRAHRPTKLDLAVHARAVPRVPVHPYLEREARGCMQRVEAMDCPRLHEELLGVRLLMAALVPRRPRRKQGALGCGFALEEGLAQGAGRLAGG